MKTRDIDIRTCLHDNLSREFMCDTETKIFHELVLCQGEARIDIAVVNGKLHGYEIKSESDTLERLPKQVEVYNKIFDEVTLVTGNCHLDNVKALIPEWWGISIAEKDNDMLYLKQIRPSQKNQDKNIEAFSLAQFLWKEELIRLLESINLNKKAKKLPRYMLWEYVAENIPLETLKDFVRHCLKTRNYERVDLQRK